jgi:hypothetical protein
MSKSLLNLLVQISKLCQKSEFQIKFENVLFLELGPAQVSAQQPGPFGQPALPPLLLGLGLPVGSAQPDPLPH